MTDCIDQPIFHLSFPVRDLTESITFYTETLNGAVGRREEGWADVALFGAQVTLQNMPSDVLCPMPRSRHFGATIGWAAWESLTVKLKAQMLDGFVEPPTITYQGTEREQAKAMLSDPSGNLIEIKAYRNPSAVLGILAGATA
jgi:extradiol dioxygenase family protein